MNKWIFLIMCLNIRLMAMKIWIVSSNHNLLVRDYNNFYKKIKKVEREWCSSDYLLLHKLTHNDKLSPYYSGHCFTQSDGNFLPDSMSINCDKCTGLWINGRQLSRIFQHSEKHHQAACKQNCEWLVCSKQSLLFWLAKPVIEPHFGNMAGNKHIAWKQQQNL